MKAFSREKKIIQALVLIGILLLSVTFTNQYIQATTFSWKWPSTNQNILIKNVTGESVWNSVISASASKWTNISGSGIKVYYTSTSTNPDTYLSYQGQYHASLYASIYVYDKNGNFISDTSTAVPVETKIRMYSDKVRPLDNTGKTQMMTHEIGHILGLAHPASATKSVMVPSKAFNYSGPQPYDQSELANRY